jgi:hypothetical protein
MASEKYLDYDRFGDLYFFMVNAKTIITSQHFDVNYGYMILFLSVFGTTIPTVLFVKSIPKIGAGISSIF